MALLKERKRIRSIRIKSLKKPIKKQSEAAKHVKKERMK